MKELTRAEEQLMQILWKIKKGFIKDLIDRIPEPKPAYNTVSTFMRILVNKHVVGYESLGNSHRYYPLITREVYMENFMTSVKNTFFRGSFRSMISFFAEKEDLSTNEIESIIEILNENKNELP